MFVLFSEPFKFKEIVEMKFEIFDKINNYCLRILSVAFSIIIYFLYLYLQWTCKPTCGLTERFHPKRAKILSVFKFDFFFCKQKTSSRIPVQSKRQHCSTAGHERSIKNDGTTTMLFT